MHAFPTKLILPLITLAVGVALGRFWRDLDIPAFVPAAAQPAGGQTSVHGPSDQAAGVHRPGLQSNLDSLTEDYSSRVKRQTAGTSLAAIQATVRELAAKPDAAGSRTLRAELMRAWARHDADSAWNYVKALSPGLDRQAMVEAVAGELAKAQPQEALKRALALDSPALRKEALKKVFEDWAQVDARAAVGYWNSHTELPSDILESSTLFSSLARSQPALAAELALNCRTPNSYNYPELGGALRAWADQDPVATAKWAESVTDPRFRDKALAAAAQGLMYVDPEQAWRIAAKLESASEAKELTHKLMMQWMDIDPSGTMDYLTGLPDAQAKNMVSSVSLAAGRMSPADQQQLLARLPEGETKSSLLASLVRTNSEAERYVDAIGLLNGMPDAPPRDRSLHSLVIKWAEKDAPAAWQWIQQQPDSSDRDIVLSAYATNLARTDPTTAAPLVLGIPDKTLRNGALTNIYCTWARTDMEAASAWFDALPGFSPEEKDFAHQNAKFAELGSNSGGILVVPAPTVGERR